MQGHVQLLYFILDENTMPSTGVCETCLGSLVAMALCYLARGCRLNPGRSGRISWRRNAKTVVYLDLGAHCITSGGQN